MNRHGKAPEQALEADPVWDLIDQAPTQPASAEFVRKTVQMVREQRQQQTWWQRWLASARRRPSASIAGLAAAAACVAFAFTLLPPKDQAPGEITLDSPQAEEIQEAIATEMLMAAAENPSEFSDQELVVLLGL